MSDSILRDKSKDFAKQIVLLNHKLRQDYEIHVLLNQLLRSGTSIGANIHEAQYAQNTLDFISKLEIALKECAETSYWLELLFETGHLEEADFRPLIGECGLIRKMLISSCKTLKNNEN